MSFYNIVCRFWSSSSQGMFLLCLADVYLLQIYRLCFLFAVISSLLFPVSSCAVCLSPCVSVCFLIACLLFASCFYYVSLCIVGPYSLMQVSVTTCVSGYCLLSVISASSSHHHHPRISFVCCSRLLLHNYCCDQTPLVGLISCCPWSCLFV